MELEGVYLDYLAKALGHNRIWPIRPLLPPTETGAVGRGGSSSVSVSTISTWLDACEDRTVVFVTLLSNKQLEELSLGLEKSGVKFILVVKDKTESDYGMLPTGFEDRVEGRGVVIRGWAPQVVILRHSRGRILDTMWVELDAGKHCSWSADDGMALIENELDIGVQVYVKGTKLCLVPMS